MLLTTWFTTQLSISALSLGNVAWAEDVTEAAAKTSQGFGLNPAEIVLLSAPPLLYGIFSLYRSQVNNQAKVWRQSCSLCLILIIHTDPCILTFADV